MPAGSSESLAEEALGQAIRSRCRGASWQGLARELAWRAVTGGHRDARQVEPLAARAEAMLASLFDRRCGRSSATRSRAGTSTARTTAATARQR